MSNPSGGIAVRNFYELLLICRPKNAISFAAEYFDDEKKTNPEYYHALRVLPYLISDTKNFTKASATIFSHLLDKNSTTHGSGGAASVIVNTETVKNIIAILLDESYIRPIPVEVRAIIDASISIPTLGFAEFDIYLRLTVRTSVLLHCMKDLISACCACRMQTLTENSNGATSSYASLTAEELLVCISNPKIKKIVANMPSFSDGVASSEMKLIKHPSITRTEVTSIDNDLHHALVSAIKSLGGKKDVVNAGITALDIVKEFLFIAP